MAIKNIYVGAADDKYFVDLQCDNEHDGRLCECKQVSLVNSRKRALKIGNEKAKELVIPLHTDWD